MTHEMTRRGFVRTTLVSVGALIATGCDLAMKRLATADNSGFSPVSHSFETSELCPLNVAQMRGPFFITQSLVRRDITEGRAGAPLNLGFKVVDTAGCRPLAGAIVEIWHCDAEGNYSGYPSYPPDEFPMVDPDSIHEPENAERYCRGVQVADADGRVEFDTIVPGWYTPRAPHIHVRVSMPGATEVSPDDERLVLTNQVYFPDALTSQLYSTRAPYSKRGVSPYTNLNDGVINESGGADGGYLHITQQESASGERYRGTITLGVVV